MFTRICKCLHISAFAYTHLQMFTRLCNARSCVPAYTELHINALSSKLFIPRKTNLLLPLCLCLSLVLCLSFSCSRPNYLPAVALTLPHCPYPCLCLSSLGDCFLIIDDYIYKNRERGRAGEDWSPSWWGLARCGRELKQLD